MKIVKIGKFDENGSPTGWHFDVEFQHGSGKYCLGLDTYGPGSVDVNGVEIVEWTERRKNAMGT